MSSRRNRNRGRNTKNARVTSSAQGSAGSPDASSADAVSPAVDEDLETALEGADGDESADTPGDVTDDPDATGAPDSAAVLHSVDAPDAEADLDLGSGTDADARDVVTPASSTEAPTPASSPASGPTLFSAPSPAAEPVEDAWLQEAFTEPEPEPEPAVEPASKAAIRAAAMRDAESGDRWTVVEQSADGHDQEQDHDQDQDQDRDRDHEAGHGTDDERPGEAAATSTEASRPEGARAAGPGTAESGTREHGAPDRDAPPADADAEEDADFAGDASADADSGTPPRAETGRDFAPAFPVPVTMSPKAKKFGWSRDSLLPHASGEDGASGASPESVERAPRRPAGTKPGRGMKAPRPRTQAHGESRSAQEPSSMSGTTTPAHDATPAHDSAPAPQPIPDRPPASAPAAAAPRQHPMATPSAPEADTTSAIDSARPGTASAAPTTTATAPRGTSVARGAGAPSAPSAADSAVTSTSAGDASEGEGPYRNVVQVLSPYLRRHRAVLITGSISLLLSVWLLIALPFPLKYAVDAAIASTGADLPALSGLDEDPGRALITSVIVLGGLLILQFITRFVAISALGRAGVRIATSLRSRLLAHLHRLTPGSADHPASAARASRRGGRPDADPVRPLIDDIAALRDLLSHSGPRAAASALTLLSLLVVTVILDPLTALVLAVTGALFALAVGVGVRRSRAAEARAAVEAQMLADTADELVAATGTIQSYGLESRSERGLTEAGVRAGRALTRARRAQAMLQLLTVLVAGIGVTGTLLLGGPRVEAGTMTPGDLVMLLADLLIVVVVLRELLQHGGALKRATAAGDRIAALLARQVGITEPQRTQPVDRVGGEIVFSAINTQGSAVAGVGDGAADGTGRPFGAAAETTADGPLDGTTDTSSSTAPSSAEHSGAQLFDTVSLVVPAGQHVALLDHEGREAAALISYLLRFDQPDTGRVLLDRFDTRAVSLTDLRRQIAVVQREPVLFTDTVRENIRIGRPDATDAEVADAARRAGIDDVIAQLAQGFDTVLVGRGNVLSDGQRRRIAIARALLRDAPIVVLDAADSGLSGAERRPVMAALVTLLEGRTAIVSSRDPETVAAADRVLWFEGGEVREDGAPSVLAAQEDSRLARWLRSQDESV
ncbi:ABC transporter transmembrane domain-containing protein [Brachybacterium alimentarium]|uniref:ABC transporter transmembrane domain-containing protein n=1 Tax=Brachybacterium alimentarium TaxID=47845 RepID=UPI003FD08A21